MIGVIAVLLTEAHEWAEALWIKRGGGCSSRWPMAAEDAADGLDPRARPTTNRRRC